MNKNNTFLSLLLIFMISGSPAAAQQPKESANTINQPAAKKSAQSSSKKKINIDFENETVMGDYDVPDAQFINSRRMIKYKELFNRRTNFIEEIDSNKGLFNEYQK